MWSVSSQEGGSISSLGSLGSLSLDTKEPTQPNPINVFHVWYPELCQRSGSHPLYYIKAKKQKSETVLDFVCDRLRPEDWTCVLSALRLDSSLHVIAIRSRTPSRFLHEVDTEEKMRRSKRRIGSIFTTYILRALHKSLYSCIQRNRVLTSLELDSIPAGVEDIELIVHALQQSQSLKRLSFKNSRMGDCCCKILCVALQNLPNVEVLILSGCDLGPQSAQAIAKVVKLQQIARYCESWHHSLRYEDPDQVIMAGLKRITLNSNPGIGDAGLLHILDELDDDLWIHALDMQRCGITNAIMNRVLDVVKHSRSLEIADFRSNDLLPEVLESIFDLLRTKPIPLGRIRYKWCFSTSTLSAFGSSDATSQFSTVYPSGKPKSAPVSAVMPSVGQLKRVKTSIVLARMPKRDDVFDNMKKSVHTLHSQLQRQVSKLHQSEMENNRLKQELARYVRKSTTIEQSPAQKKIKYSMLNNDIAKLTIHMPRVQLSYDNDVRRRFSDLRKFVQLPGGDADKWVNSADVKKKAEVRGELAKIQQDEKVRSKEQQAQGDHTIGMSPMEKCIQKIKSNPKFAENGPSGRPHWKRANTAFLQIAH